MTDINSGQTAGSVPDIYTAEFDRSDPKAYFTALSDRINTDLGLAVTTDFPPNLYNPMRYVLSTRGKRFRPILLIMACEAAGGGIAGAYNAALAIEILHNFTLVHDDIMDDDDLRRGRETVHKKWDESIAILAGDGLIALAYRYLLRSESPRIRDVIGIFSEAIINICEGQSLDKDMEQQDNVSIDDYLYMIGRKTGILMAVSAEIGGILGGGAEPSIAALRDFAMEMGIAFQIQDDVLDIVSEEQVIGKDLGSDLAQGKKTYPILLFFERASESEITGLRKTLTDRNAGSGELEAVRKLLAKYDIVESARAEVNRRLDRAVGFLEKQRGMIDPANLTFLSEMIRNRKY